MIGKLSPFFWQEIEENFSSFGRRTSLGGFTNAALFLIQRTKLESCYKIKACPCEWH